jgi:2-polyprenyl-6-methoxyphenol hydroxylase-like FAD-dependent oxidoreductase
MQGDGIRVLIVGAGIAGLATARMLHRWGAAVDIVERSPVPASVGTGIYLPGNAVRALDRLGVGAAVLDRAARIERQRVLDHRGRVLLDIAMGDLWRGVGPCVAMHRAELHRILLDAVEAPVQWSCGPQAVALLDEGAAIEFTDGHSDRYDLVIGADGINSTIRRLVFDGVGPRPVGQYAYRFLVARPDPAPEWSVRLGPGTSFLTIPIGGGRTYCYCDMNGDAPVRPRDALVGYAEPVPTLLAALDDPRGGVSQHGPIEEVVLDSWVRGGVLLVGDAAHATSPNMAQGAAMAVEDALVLAECLGGTDGIPAAMAAYEQRRRPRTDWVLRQTHRRDRTRTLQPAIRNLFLRRLGERMFHANYRPLRELP